MIDIYYILRGLIYAQSLLWIKLLDYDYDIKNNLIKISFTTSLGLLYIWLSISNFSFNQYTNNLLMFYVFLMLYAYVILRVNYNFYNSVCLTFLLVFINSYYWEFMLHFNVIVFYGLNFNQFIQALHLIPAYLLYRKLEITNKPMFKKILLYGMIISGLNLLELNFIPNGFVIFGKWFHLRSRINNLTRFICINTLLYALIKYTKLIKKEGKITISFLDNTPN
ncbi:hypothetical protein ES702_00727 [subsurface metagenome]